jgi:hypothetical protein
MNYMSRAKFHSQVLGEGQENKQVAYESPFDTDFVAGMTYDVSGRNRDSSNGLAVVRVPLV